MHCYFSFKTTGKFHRDQALALGSYLESVPPISMGKERKTLRALFSGLDLAGVPFAAPWALEESVTRLRAPVFVMEITTHHTYQSA